MIVKILAFISAFCIIPFSAFAANELCVDATSEALSSLQVFTGTTKIKGYSGLMSIEAGDVIPIKFVIHTSHLSSVQHACFSDKNKFAFRVSASSAVRFGEGNHFSGYKAATSTNPEFGYVDFKIPELDSVDEALEFNAAIQFWSEGTQSVRVSFEEFDRTKKSKDFSAGTQLFSVSVEVGSHQILEVNPYPNKMPLRITTSNRGTILEDYGDFFELKDRENNLLYASFGNEVGFSATGRFGQAVTPYGFKIFDFAAGRIVYEVNLKNRLGSRDHRLNAVAWTKDDSFVALSVTAEGGITILPTLVNVVERQAWNVGNFAFAGGRHQEPGTSSSIVFDYEKMTFRSFYAKRSLISSSSHFEQICSFMEERCEGNDQVLGDWSELNWTNDNLHISYYRPYKISNSTMENVNLEQTLVDASHNFYKHRIGGPGTYMRHGAIFDIPAPIYWKQGLSSRFIELISHQGFDVPKISNISKIYTTNFVEATRIKKRIEKISKDRKTAIENIDKDFANFSFDGYYGYLTDMIDFLESEVQHYADGYGLNDELASSDPDDLVYFPNKVENTFKYFSHYGFLTFIQNIGLTEKQISSLVYFDQQSGMHNFLSSEEAAFIDELDSHESDCIGSDGRIERILPWAVRDIWRFADGSGDRFWLIQSSCTGGLRGDWHSGQLMLIKLSAQGNFAKLMISDKKCYSEESCVAIRPEVASVRAQVINNKYLSIKGFANTLSIISLDQMKEIGRISESNLDNSSLMVPDNNLKFVLSITSSGRVSIRSIIDNKVILKGSFVDDELLLSANTGHFFATGEGADFLFLKFSGDEKLYSANQLYGAYFVPEYILQKVISLSKQPRMSKIVRPPQIGLVSDKNGEFSVTAQPYPEETQLLYFADGALRKAIRLPKNKLLDVTQTPHHGAGTHEFVRIDQNHSKSDILTIKSKKTSKGKLFFLSIGFGEYVDDRINDLDYSESDAETWCKWMLDQQKSKLYSSVNDLSNGCKKLTAREIVEILSQLKSKIGSNDTFMMFFSGHGTRNGLGDFFLLPNTVNLNSLDTTAIPWKHISSALNSLPARTILLLDACHSGFFHDLTTNDGLVASLSSPNVTIISASKGRQKSWESRELEGGVFSRAALSTLSAPSLYDKSGDQMIDPDELYQVVRVRVNRFTNAKQTPWISRSLPINGGPLF